MKRIIGITAALICSLFFQSSVIAQEIPANPQIKDSKPVFEKPIKKEFRPSTKMPHKIRKALEFFKFADELQLTDDQIIKLRAFYKKYNSQKPEIKEPQKASNMPDFYKMTDEELVKYAEEEAMKKKQKLMFRLQKIIELRKILTKEQLETIKKNAEDRRAKNKPSRKPLPPRNYMMPPMWPQFGMMNHVPPMGCCPQMGMMPQPPMRPMHQPGMMPHRNMPPMGCCPQMGMMPQPFMRPMHQPGMMPHRNMPPMGCPQMGMMPQPPMRPMHQPCMMPHRNMPPMGCPQMGMMPQPPMRPMPKLDKLGKNKQPNQKFAQKNHFPMMNPMGFYPGYMPQTNMIGCCPCQMRPPMPGFRKNFKEKRPPFDFLLKLFSCKNEKESDIIQKDKTISKEELFGNPKKESSKPNEEKK
jgi:hypothetical protein